MKNSIGQFTRWLLYTFLTFVLMMIMISCSPSIQYLGDSLQPTYSLDVYYDEKDVEMEYRTLGKMTHGNFFDYEVETIKNKMIEKAKANGGDGIIFMDVQNIRDQHGDDFFGDDDRLSITAKVIKYKES